MLSDEEALPDFAPCPTCKQYSHSIGEDRIAEAFNHFQSMYAHPVRGHPMGHNFDARTRDAAQVLIAAIKSAASNAAEAERRDVVAWLKDREDGDDPFDLANAISRGDHTPSAEGM